VASIQSVRLNGMRAMENDKENCKELNGSPGIHCLIPIDVSLKLCKYKLLTVLLHGSSALISG
jgi:hypothetical protein